MKIISIISFIFVAVGLTGCGTYSEVSYGHSTYQAPRSSVGIYARTYEPAPIIVEPAPIIVGRPYYSSTNVVVVDNGHHARKKLRKAERRIERRNEKISALHHDLGRVEHKRREERHKRHAQRDDYRERIDHLDKDRYKLEKRLKREKRKARESRD